MYESFSQIQMNITKTAGFMETFLFQSKYISNI